MLEQLRKRLRRKLTGYVALVALVFGLVLPVVSHAIVPILHHDSLQVAVCTNSGIKYISLEMDKNLQMGGDEQQPSRSSHCEYCSIQIYSHSAPTVRVFWQPLAPPESFGHCLARIHPKDSVTWSRAHPRAPPLHT